ncbi:hypothetical protein PGN35_029265 [Nodosilinea sp. PGN35]|uniref:hypothetical protein n=1 Tax=Nodosilinea sp. PGN35 TaxID=3020489 RepID=UPI0023B31ACA|nr:hypothetical protein [Nodosilinea sp. TSF1-S3]MDF0368281.1 hypothetical protein [Nodosilinea sp. TSF1-S3]
MGQRHSIRWLRQVLADALTLNQDFYEHSHRYPAATRYARGIVGLAALSHGLGSGLILLLYQPSLLQLVGGILVNGLSVVAGYYLWTYAIWKLDTYIAPPVPPYRELLIPVGFAYTPQVLNLLTVIPLLGRPITLALAGWTLLGAIAAVRAGLNIGLVKATLLAGVGFTLVQVGIGLVQAGVQNLVA